MTITNLFKDKPAACWIKVTEFMLPLMTLGGLGNKTLLYISAAIGAIGLLLFVVRTVTVMTTNRSATTETKWIAAINGILGFPYIIMLCSLIALNFGVAAQFGLWIALALAVLTVAATTVKD